uniref:Uncharacterized protein n=1 Tax=Anguilla anguilla TaxID=7936 RepID=A0A0E9TKQ2_ANGAN
MCHICTSILPTPNFPNGNVNETARVQHKFRRFMFIFREALNTCVNVVYH